MNPDYNLFNFLFSLISKKIKKHALKRKLKEDN